MGVLHRSYIPDVMIALVENIITIWTLMSTLHGGHIPGQNVDNLAGNVVPVVL